MTLEELTQLMRNKLQREHEAMNQALNLGNVEEYDRAADSISEIKKILARLEEPQPEPEEDKPQPE